MKKQMQFSSCQVVIFFMETTVFGRCFELRESCFNKTITKYNQ